MLAGCKMVANKRGTNVTPVKRTDAVEETPDPKPEVNETPRTRATKDRISVTLEKDGSINLAAMRPENRERLARAFATSGEPGAISPLRVNRDFVPTMFDSLCAGIQLAGKNLFHWPDELTKHLRFNEAEKKELTEPTARVIEKYAPKWLFTHQEEFALAQALLVAAKSMAERATVLYIAEVSAARRAEAETTTATEITQ